MRLVKIVLQDLRTKKVSEEVSRRQVALIYLLYAYGDGAYEVVNGTPNTSYGT